MENKENERHVKMKDKIEQVNLVIGIFINKSPTFYREGQSPGIEGAEGSPIEGGKGDPPRTYIRGQHKQQQVCGRP